MNASKMTTGERIRDARKKAGLTQKALGEKCNMPDSQIRQYESGKFIPKIETLRRIADGLGVALYEIADWGQYTTEEFKKDLKLKNEEFEAEAQQWIKERNNDINKLINNYNSLNELGKIEAQKRIEEMTELNKYKKFSNISIEDL